ncbi:hypothetical protein PRIPAC_91213, partial [Pristionchus pacificus]
MPSYILFNTSPYFYSAAAYAAASAIITFGAVVLMIWDVQNKLRRGIKHASGATQRVQKRAITALTLQGIIPSVCFVVPEVGLSLVYFRSLSQGLEVAAHDRRASTLSALLFAVLPLHTFMHSLTILAFVCRCVLLPIGHCVFLLRLLSAIRRRRGDFRGIQNIDEHQAVLPRGNRFCWEGWRRNSLFLALHVYVWIVLAVIYISLYSVRAPVEEVPTALNWLRYTSSFIFVREQPAFYVAVGFVLFWGFSMASVVILMIIEVNRELRTGMINASSSTRKYQKLAVTALTLQGKIPRAFYTLPIVGEVLIYLTSLSMGLEAASENATAISGGLLLSMFPCGARLPAGRFAFALRLSLATLNCLTLSKDARIIELENALDKIKYDIVGLSEVRRKSAGEMDLSWSNGRLYHSARLPNHTAGVGFIVSGSIYAPASIDMLEYSTFIHEVEQAFHQPVT